MEFVGEFGDRGRDEPLGHAAELQFPIERPEPFGLAMIEALACATPVIAWRRGSIPEVLDDGVTGYIVTSIDKAVAAVGKIEHLRRAMCRRTLERRFDASGMARDYLDVYRGVLMGARSGA